MFKSKELKENTKIRCLENKFQEWLYDRWLVKKYKDFVYYCIRKPYEDALKMYGWYTNVFKKNEYDWEGHSLYAIMEYKFQRLEKNLQNGHAIQDPQDMKALALAIKLSKRLKEDRYEDRAWDRIEKKWGKLKTWFTPIEGKEGYSSWNAKYEKENTLEDKNAIYSEKMGYYKAADMRRKREERWLYDILHKHLRSWWD